MDDASAQDAAREAVAAERPISILRLIHKAGATSSPYNQFSLAWRRLHDVTLCTYFPSDATPPPEIDYYPGDATVRGFARVLHAALAAKRHDVVHIHSPQLAFLWLLLTAHRRSSLPPSLYTLHNMIPNYPKLRTRLLLLPAFAALGQIVCCGEASRASVTGLYRALAGRRLVAVPNGVDLERVDRTLASCTPTPDPDSFRIAVIGRLIGIKNPLRMLEAFRESWAPSGRLVFIGHGSLDEPLRERAVAWGIGDRVELTGLIPRDQVYQRLLESDLYVSPSRGEGLPIAALEAMACGRPVVLSDILPHREIADGADFVPLVGVDDVRGYAEQIGRFREMSPDERRILGERCRRLVEERFSLDVMRRGYERLYRKLARS